jgi:hypothetical protein
MRKAPTVLPPAPPGIVPYIAGWSEERLLRPELVVSHREAPFPSLGYADETPHDRDSFGQLWARPLLLPKRRRGEPRFERVHPYRQRRAMLNMMCQVCSMIPASDGPYFFLLRSTGGPVREGELTTSPPVCVPCAGIAIQLCRALRGGQWVAAWAGQAPAWGVAGVVHHPYRLKPVRDDLQHVEYETHLAPWTIAHRLVVQLVDVRPADLEAELAGFGTARLEEEFARVAALQGTALLGANRGNGW